MVEWYCLGTKKEPAEPRGQSYKAHFGINYIKNGFSKLNFPLNYINFDVIYAKKIYRIDPRSFRVNPTLAVWME